MKAFAQALVCLFTPGVLLAQQPFQFNTYYMCGTAGRVSVASCIDRSDKPYNDCIVQYWDKPRLANGMPPGGSIGYHQLTVALPRCRLLGADMMAAARDKVQKLGEGESGKTIAVEAGKQAVQAGASALDMGGSAMAGTPGAQDVAKAWQSFQDAGGMPVAKMVAEQKLEDAGIRSTDATINKMVDQSSAEKSKFADNDFNRMHKAVEQDAMKEPAKTVDDSKFVNPKGPEDSKFLSDELKAKYLSRAQDLKQDTNQASAHWDSSNPKPPQHQPAADTPAVSASPSPSPTTSSPSPSPSPKP